VNKLLFLFPIPHEAPYSERIDVWGNHFVKLYAGERPINMM